MIGFTPREIVSELDKYIVGQDDAKRAVAIALRNRWRRQHVPLELRDEIAPKNIIMIGPTGVGKTEIARRLAKLAQAPFIKVEASKYTEVGYVGRDVESMVRDLVDLAVTMLKQEETERVRERAAGLAEERLLDVLLPPLPRPALPAAGAETPGEGEGRRETREKLRGLLRAGKLDERSVEIEVQERALPLVEIFSSAGAGMDQMDVNVRDLFGNLFPPRRKRRTVTVGEARAILEQEEAQKLIDMEQVVRQALARCEESGIIFLDELDKIAGRERGAGPDVSREGVQRDLLPIIEGSTVSTKHGLVKTDHILFIAAGAFHATKPSDLIPELQGRFPIRVELSSLGEEEFVRILTEPSNALVKQYTALLATEGIDLSFTEAAIREIAHIARVVNDRTENIGARRLHTVLERLLDDVSFHAPEWPEKTLVIDAPDVRERLEPLVKDEDLSRYIL